MISWWALAIFSPFRPFIFSPFSPSSPFHLSSWRGVWGEVLKYIHCL
ncbi:hypothetical protein HMPREF1991_02779 [Hoylesella loescheii DSM 19665 = JCM 12249 = ATCC 15930]|uniref:Uncharacterized protein n=1 Tax=Hoylesella loescheii DSM 19665 = JCM 12249 = ATCC 15930 TaxID=1122985 RepID=A0A069QGN5_HOYLO|nr:hypothetical protein HMPREF1991_02779 [Hoylesella loescheii DSM 19665 = JCM 12249 = ATCC 15930]